MISRHMSMGSTAFWDAPDLQHPANSAKHLETVDSNAEEALPSSSSNPQLSNSNEQSLSHSASGSGSNGHMSPGTRRTAKVRKRHLGMLQTMLEASRRAAEFVTSFRSGSITAIQSVAHVENSIERCLYNSLLAITAFLVGLTYVLSAVCSCCETSIA